MSKARDLADFGSNPDEQTSIITVTVAGGKFVIDGTSQQTITMAASGVYKFDQSHSSNASHPLKISTTSDGTHGGGSAITVDFVAVGTAGSAGAYVTYTIQQDGADNYFYYCGNHSGMGGSIRKSGNPTAAEILTSIKTVDGSGSGLDADTLDGVEAAALLPLSGGTMTGNLAYGDNVKATFGAGSDLQIYHDGSNSYIDENGTGNLNIRTINGAAISLISGSENMITAETDGAVSLYHNNAIKMATSATGATITGTLAATALTGDGAGITGLSGGGEQTFTAGAAISAGDLVSIKSNGTIQTSVGETSGIVTISGSNPLMSHYRQMRSAFNGTDKIVIVYMDHSQNIVAYVGTIANGTNLSWGSKVTVASATKTHPDVCYDSNAGKFLVVWRNDSSSYRGEAAVGTVSGTSISFGSTVVWDSGGASYNEVVYDDNAQKSMILYATASGGVKAVVATISGTSVSFGTALTIQNNGDSAGGYINLVYDNNANKFVAIFALGNAARLIVLTISGTSITYGSNNDFENQIPYYMQAHFNKNLNKVVIVWYRDSSPSGWVAVAGSISGTTVSLGTILTGGSIASPSQGYDETAQKSYTFVDGTGVYREFAFSGNNISVLASPTRDYAPETTGSTVYSLGFESYAGPKLNFFLWEYATLASTLLQSAEVLPWVGIAAENISSGATGKITVAGGINTSVSGLTAGSTYGLPANSSAITAIPLGGNDENRIFGTALSATSIYIDKGTLR